MSEAQTYSDVAELGRIIRQARTKAGLSQRKVAALADVTQNWVMGIEAGRVQGADTTRLIRLAEAVGLRFALVPIRGGE